MTSAQVFTKPGSLSARGDGPSRARRAAKRKSQLAAFAFIAPVTAFVLIFFLYPIFRTAQLSVVDYSFASYFTGEAPFVGITNYVRVVQDSLFLPVVWHTLVFTLVSIIAQFILGLALAVFFTNHFPLSGFFRSLILIPWLVPIIVSATTWRWMLYKDYGVLNYLLGTDIGWLSDPAWSLAAVTIANVWLGIPFNLVLLYGGLQAIPAGLYEAAALDGAGTWRRFRFISLPLLRPVILVTLLLGFVYTVKAFDIVWIITQGGPANSSHTLATWAYEFSFVGGAEQSLSMGATVSMLLFFTALISGLIYVRVQRKEVGQ